MSQPIKRDSYLAIKIRGNNLVFVILFFLSVCLMVFAIVQNSQIRKIKDENYRGTNLINQLKNQTYELERKNSDLEDKVDDLESRVDELEKK
jgi:uncharacterized protein YlxW (UPF0749 family)